MPKTSRNLTHRTSNQSNSTLRRNQACHQCRRRKLKCDAQKPCSTCVRSYKYALAHTLPGSEPPPTLECTFDEGFNESPEVDVVPGKYEKLENRIVELEEMLRQRSITTLPSNDSNSSHSQKSSPPLIQTQISTSHIANGINGQRTPFFNSEIFFPNWPPNLPDPELLHHLVELFFIFQPHACQMFHKPTFMASLALPPNHAKFPAQPLLHAICAMASRHTSLVTSGDPSDYSMPGLKKINQKYQLNENGSKSFADQQVQFAKETASELETVGANLFQVLQANVILSWYFCSQARSAELLLSTGHSLRLAVPLGLNVCPPFNSMTATARSHSFFPPAKTVIEDETRRNTFWLAYAIERLHGCSNGWASSLDDADLFQLLPVTVEKFQKAELVPPSERQWAHSRDVLSVHSETQFDPFIFYIKSSLLVSRVKTFNLRFRGRLFSGEESLTSTSEPIDPRSTLAFTELDRLVTSFLSKIPASFRSPIKDGVVDPNLVPAIAVGHLAIILLHEPHAKLENLLDCTSAQKTLAAARAIVSLICELWSTSYDLSLLESFTAACFYHAGRALIRFLRAALTVLGNDPEDMTYIQTLQSQVSIIRSACDEMSKLHCLPYRFSNMLNEELMNALHGTTNAT